jgi:hypothetical protein
MGAKLVVVPLKVLRASNVPLLLLKAVQNSALVTSEKLILTDMRMTDANSHVQEVLQLNALNARILL